MFISRKNYEKAIKKAKKKGARQAQREMSFQDRMNRLEEQMWRRTDELHERINKIQFEGKSFGFESNEKCSCPPPKSC